jgi:opacity protein-like surface antigen
MNKNAVKNILKLALVVSMTSPAFAGLGASSFKPITTTSPGHSSDWAIEVSTGAEFSNIRADQSEGSNQIPVKLTGVYTIDEVSNDKLLNGILRGNTEFLFSGYGRAIIDGREHHLFGIQSGPRYNFVQPGWKLVPFIESEVGLGFADSNGRYAYGLKNGPSGLGQDFNFMFTVGAGVKYDITADLYTHVAIKYTHYSNAGLSEPGRQNEGIDSAGPEFALGYRF